MRTAFAIESFEDSFQNPEKILHRILENPQNPERILSKIIREFYTDSCEEFFFLETMKIIMLSI